MKKLAACWIFIGLAASAAARDLSRYALVLPDPPAARLATRDNPTALAAARDRLRPAHESLKRQLRARNVKVVGEAYSLVNAVFVAADEAEITGLTGVAHIAKMPRYHRDLDAAIKLINVPAAWSVLSNAGAGIKLAVIDTGIDNTHPAFEDPSLTPPAGFPICGTMADCAYTNSKIIVARSYVSMLATGTGANPAGDSRPDDLSARDRVGHGTAVAMAAAGNTNTGPSDTITGVAPKAFLGSYKVFGSPGVNDYTTGDAVISALNDAFEDHMDIAELSLGGAAVFGPLDTGSTCDLPAGQACDLIASIVQTATEFGMLVVASAGNSGPAPGSIESPGDAPAAISVAGLNNSHNWSDELTVTGLGTFHAALGNGPPPSPSLTAPMADIAAVGDPQGCTAPPAGSLSGAIALIARGTCPFVIKVESAQAAGAVGVIFTNNQGDDTLVAAGGLAGVTTIPSTFVGFDDGQSIRSYLTANPQATATITANLVAFSATDGGTMASFSSRGPALAGSSVKPDVAAVGANLYLAAQSYDPNGDLYSANGYIVSQGTSFSAPQIAGLAALVKQTNRSLKPDQIKSAIVNTATADVTENSLTASLMAAGSGRANAAAAIATTLFASPASVSFGVLKTSSFPATQQIQITNTGAAQNVDIAITRRTAETTAHLSVDQPNLSIPANGSATLNVTLSGTLPSPGVYEGFIAIANLQVPFLYVVPDGVPVNILPVAGNGDIGIVGNENASGGLLFQILDRFGVPVPNLPVTFSTVSGGGTLANSDAITGTYGFAGSNDTLGPMPGIDVFSATAGGLTTDFAILASEQPTISPRGAVNAANFVNQPVAPGSYIALFGTNLAPGTSVFATPYLPLSIGGVSVSFDTPAISAPGHLFYVSAGQVVVQVPWEMSTALAAAQTAAQIKVSDSFNSGAVYNLPLATYSPAFFETSPGFAAALDENNQVVTTSNAVAQGTTVQLFLNGLGPVTNQPASGDPAPPAPSFAETTMTPTITIGQLNAPVKFSGLTPGAIGLYQINAVVPATGAGLEPITVSINGVSSTVSHIQVR